MGFFASLMNEMSEREAVFADFKTIVLSLLCSAFYSSTDY